VLDRGKDGRDYMTLRVERDHVERDQGPGDDHDTELSKKIGEEIKKQILVSADIELLEYGSLPRSERKSQRVFDNREH
jgi:phenylacetate-CoA ligase